MLNDDVPIAVGLTAGELVEGKCECGMRVSGTREGLSRIELLRVCCAVLERPPRWREGESRRRMEQIQTQCEGMPASTASDKGFMLSSNETQCNV